MIAADLDRRAAAAITTRGLGAAAARWLARPFPRTAARRVVVHYTRAAICWAQVYPFARHAAALRDRYGAAIRFVPVDRMLEGAPPPCGDGDIALVQPWFTVEPARLGRALAGLAARRPDATVGFLDSYAHNDLRLGAAVDPHVSHYFKKSIYRDPALYFRAFRGDTNLTEFYGGLYGIDADPVDWGTPTTLIPKLRLSPNFFAAPRFMDQLGRGDMPTRPGRRLDLLTRLGGAGPSWYGRMRETAQARVDAIEGIATSPPGKLSPADYMAEMRTARLCFSPFGYGELCWRDVEAIVSGAVLIKPDMDHLRTLPDLYEAGVTYLPVRWDFSDLEAVVRGALADEAGSAAIARTAWDRMAGYVRDARFVDDVGVLFDG